MILKNYYIISIKHLQITAKIYVKDKFVTNSKSVSYDLV